MSYQNDLYHVMDHLLHALLTKHYFLSAILSSEFIIRALIQGSPGEIEYFTHRKTSDINSNRTRQRQNKNDSLDCLGFKKTLKQNRSHIDTFYKESGQKWVVQSVGMAFLKVFGRAKSILTVQSFNDFLTIIKPSVQSLTQDRPLWIELKNMDLIQLSYALRRVTVMLAGNRTSARVNFGTNFEKFH